jgi:hypothetical protein
VTRVRARHRVRELASGAGAGKRGCARLSGRDSPRNVLRGAVAHEPARLGLLAQRDAHGEEQQEQQRGEEFQPHQLR